MKTIAIVSTKGGSGKTTTVLNLAVAAREVGQTVLVVDLDPQASATHWFRERSDREGLHVQPTHPAGLPDVLQAAEHQGVDLVFIDTAAQTDATAAEAVEVADVVLVTCRPSIVDLRAVGTTIRLCRVREAEPHVLLSQVEARGSLQIEARRALEGLKVHVLDATLGRRAAYHHPLVDGRTAIEFEPSGKAAHEVRRVLREVAALPSRRRDGKPARRQDSKSSFQQGRRRA